MRLFSKVSRVILATVCLSAAVALISRAGLPERADFTGTYLEGLGSIAPEVGAFAPPFTLTLLNGGAVTVPRADPPTLINFWATWCTPCEVELPILQVLHNEGTAFVVAVNMGEPEAQVRSWLAERQLTLPTALDTDLAVARLYHVRGQPSTYIVRPDGRISQIIFGAASEAALRSYLLP